MTDQLSSAQVEESERIAELEAALREIVAIDDQPGGFGEPAYWQGIGQAADIARKALGLPEPA